MSKWRPDDADLIQKCFEFDWNHGKLPKMVKNEEEK
jgi:hypothetical protein